MPLAYTLINTDTELATCAQKLAEETVLAFDLEFDREQYSYGFTLCLIQIASPTHCYLIDPFNIQSLQAIIDILEEPKILKLLHSCGEDLRLLHSINCFPTNMADTDIMCRWMDMEQLSLASLISTYCGKTISKQLQRSNWTLRPLKPEQLTYAVGDVEYLFELYETLKALATEKDTWQYIQQEFDWLGIVRFDDTRKYPFLKQGDEHKFKPIMLHILNGMMELRDATAQKLNKPLFMIMPEALLKDIVLNHVELDVLLVENKVHKYVKQPHILEQWMDTYNQLREEAAKLPTPSPKGAGYVSTLEFKKIQNETFLPIQEALANRFGANTSRFILSNRTLTGIIKGESKISTIQPAFKPALVQQAANDLNIGISKWW